MTDARSVHVCNRHCQSFQTVEHVAEILAEIIFNERAGFQLQCAEITDRAQFSGQVDLHKISCNILLRQELPEGGIVGNRRGVFLR